LHFEILPQYGMGKKNLVVYTALPHVFGVVISLRAAKNGGIFSTVLRLLVKPPIRLERNARYVDIPGDSTAGVMPK
jgi:hypothetical protein